MPITLPHNPYRGVNAHLHSKFQRRGGSPSMWTGFHSAHISHLADALNETLPPAYQAIEEQSLQIVGADRRSRPRPDITIYDESAGRGPTADSAALGQTATWTAPLVDVLIEPDEIPAIIIYRASETSEHDELGEAVVRFELFSPANKAGGSYFSPYLRGRQRALHSGLVLVEIDYLHETTSPIPGFPRYPNEAQSYPYSITISDPRLPPDQTAVFSYGFGVDVRVPSLNIPLSGSDMVTLDFNVVYQRTFVARRWGKQVDYAQEPERMETYRDDDQAAIRARMAAVLAEQDEA